MKINPKGFTNYYGPTEMVTIISYDGDKYVDIIRFDGSEDQIKRGYIYKNLELTRFFVPSFWYVLTGKTLKTYVSIKKTTEYLLSTDDTRLKRTFRNKNDAIKYALLMTIHYKKEIQIIGYVTKEGRLGYSSRGYHDVLCAFGSEFVTQYQYRGNGQIKYLRGHGKLTYGNNKTSKNRYSKH